MELEDSILVTIKRLLGIGENYEAFDQEIMVFVNGAIFKLGQLGIGPPGGFCITGVEEDWSDLLGDKQEQLQAAKDYIYFDVRLSWDPPTQSSVINAWNEKLKELTWRLLHQVEDSAPAVTE